MTGYPEPATRTVARTGYDDNSRRRNVLEVRGRAWAAARGIHTPVTVEAEPDGSLLVSEYVSSLPSAGPTYVEAALELAEAVSAAPEPAFGIAASGWRASRMSLPIRVARLAAAGIDPVVFVRARRRVARIPSQVTVHGDFHPGNVLNLGDGSVCLLDFEHAGRGPRHADVLRLVTTLEELSDAEYGLELLLRAAAREDRGIIADQLEWLSLRHLVDLVTGRVSRPRVSAAHIRWRLARHWARDIRNAL